MGKAMKKKLSKKVCPFQHSKWVFLDKIGILSLAHNNFPTKNIYWRNKSRQEKFIMMDHYGRCLGQQTILMYLFRDDFV